MILSRRNANLVRPCFAFLRRGRKAVIKGRDIGAGLLKLVKTMKAKDIYDLMDKTRIHRQARIDKLMSEKSINQSMIQRVEDECDCVLEIALGCDSLAQMEGHIEKIFSEDTQGIMLSSIHRSKGLEADMVSIVDYTRIRLNHDKMTPEDHIQEKNLHFVAVTRAKKVLHLIDESFRDE
jgi:DNA helicase-2/ATP-dependent DNA helicase PcrA